MSRRHATVALDIHRVLPSLVSLSPRAYSEARERLGLDAPAALHSLRHALIVGIVRRRTVAGVRWWTVHDAGHVWVLTGSPGDWRAVAVGHRARG